MASNQVLLVLLWGGIWKSLSTAIPQNISVNQKNAHSSSRSPAEDKAPLQQWQDTDLGLQRSGRALPAPPPTAEPGDSSWVAPLIIGIILIGMLMAITVIIVWKCCKRPVLVDSHWAGGSPFAGGEMPDVFMDSEQATTHSSVLFMLPWKMKQDTHLQQDPTESEKPPTCTTSNKTNQLPPPAENCSLARASGAHTDAASFAPVSCPPPVPSPECPDLPPPPDWFGEPTEDHSADVRKDQEFHSEAEEQFPPPPELLIQEIHEPLPQ
ncbi:EVI2B protein, partial [Oreotrochilus melanogaster]|nr:EVI2B protein [Oreotrochilus melanogaster]